jgi:hypothetical protein
MISDRALALVLRSPRSRALWGDLTRALVAAIVIVICAAWVAYYVVLARAMVEQYHLNDFGKFYYSTQMFLAGEDMYGPNPATSMYVGPGLEHRFLNVNPPHFHLLLLPLARMPALTALTVWSLASLLSLAFCLGVVVRELDLTITPTRALWSLLALLSFAATGAVIITGQLSLLLLLPLTLAWRAARRDRWSRAATWIGVAMSVKPFLLIFVPYFMARRQWLAVAYAIATFITAFGIGRYVFGIEAYESWGRTLAGTDWPWAAMNGSILGVLVRSLAESPYYSPVALARSLIRPLWLIGALSVLISTLRVAVRDRSPMGVDRGFALMLVGALLVSPLGWVYYLWLPLGPVLALAVTWHGEGRRSPLALQILAGAAAVCLICPLVLVTAWQPSAWLTLTLGSAYFWGTLLLWSALMFDRAATRPVAVAADAR